MENFIINLWNAWTLVDLAIMLILAACWYFTNEKKRDLQTEYNYSEFMLKCEQTKLENERTQSLSLKIESEKRLIEIGKLKYVLKISEGTIKCINDQISRKNQPRDSQGHFIKVKKEPEIKVTEWICNTTKYEPHFTKEVAYKPSEIKSKGSDLIHMIANSGATCLVYKSDFKPVTK
jgi:hypothetical protein